MAVIAAVVVAVELSGVGALEHAGELMEELERELEQALTALGA